MTRDDASAYLIELRAKRLKWVEANRDNQFDDGIRRLLADLYPDEAHFVFELLQNAEDANASEVHFDLRHDRLVVTHDGRREFTKEDVDSITSIGKTTKGDDVNQIGKFGIGFKAVFAYTATPAVFSGSFSFEIHDLVCPHLVPHGMLAKGKTRFEFPFNGPKPTTHAFQEVAAWLNGMADNTLLFLRNIKALSWEVAGIGRGLLRREQFLHDIIEVQRKVAGHPKPTRTHWLRFEKPVHEDPRQFVALAFRLAFLEKDEVIFDEDRPIAEQVKVVPVNGQLSIFFPADKECTKLKFHLHGPYASTVARDSIPHRDDNRRLLQLTASLLSESLDQLQQTGLLTPEFLEVLPNPTDELDLFYQPLLEEILKALTERPLVPVHKGGHAPARELLLAPAAIRNVVENTDLPFFSGRPSAKWVAGVMQGQRAERLLRALNINEWGSVEMLQRTDALFAPETLSENAQNWLIGRTDDWMQAFYALLHELLEERLPWDVLYRLHSPNDPCKPWKIVRASDGTHRLGKELFFLDPKQAETERVFPAVKHSILLGNRRKQVEAAKAFLVQTGVREVDESERIIWILDHYYAQEAEPPEWDEHVVHVKRFAAFVEESEHTTLFADYFIFWDSVGEQWLTPSDAYVDQPIENTGLAVLFTSGVWSENQRHPLAAAYAKGDIPAFNRFLKKVGVLFSLPISKIGTLNNPHVEELLKGTHGARETDYCIDEDYTIEGINFLVDCHNRDISLLIWHAVSRSDRDVLQACYRPNSARPVRTAASQLVCVLKDAAWIPTRRGEFCKPSFVAKNDLPDDFAYDNRNGWLTAIGFGTSQHRSPNETKEREQAAKCLGIDADLAEQLGELTPEERAEVTSETRQAVARVKAKRHPKGDRGEAQRASAGVTPLAAAPRISEGKPAPGTQCTANDSSRVAIQAEADRGHGAPFGGSNVAEDVDRALYDAFNKQGKLDIADDRQESGSVRNPEERRKRTRDNYSNRKAIEQPAAQRVSSRVLDVWDQKNKAIRDFLYEEYAGRCQICGEANRFPRRDGRAYFEAVYLIPHTQAAWTDEPGSVICLCALCSAKFQHGAVECENIAAQMRAQKAQAEGGRGKPMVSLRLVGKQVNLTFSERHVIEVQELLAIANLSTSRTTPP